MHRIIRDVIIGAIAIGAFALGTYQGANPYLAILGSAVLTAGIGCLIPCSKGCTTEENCNESKCCKEEVPVFDSEADEPVPNEIEEIVEEVKEVVKKRRGRPKGSKNKK